MSNLKLLQTGLVKLKTSKEIDVGMSNYLDRQTREMPLSRQLGTTIVATWVLH